MVQLKVMLTEIMKQIKKYFWNSRVRTFTEQTRTLKNMVKINFSETWRLSKGCKSSKEHSFKKRGQIK